MSLKVLVKKYKIENYINCGDYFLFLHCIMSVVSYSISHECTASSFRVTDLIQVDVEGMGEKKMLVT